MKLIRVKEKNWIESRGYRKNILVTGADLECEGTLVQIVVSSPGNVVKPHYHARAYEFLYVLEGESTMEIAGQAIELKPGDMVLTEPGDVHRLHVGAADFKVLVCKTNAFEDDTAWIEKA